MSYQERRRQRIKKEEKKTLQLRRKSSRMSWIVCLAGIALLVLYRINAPSASTKTSSAVSSASNSASSVVSSTVSPGSDRNAAQEKAPLRADWRLIVVNRQSPLPANFTVVLTKRSDGFRVDARIEPELEEMFVAALQDDVTLKICSAYRGVSQQGGLYHPERYASGSPVSVQPAGESEHHTGLALDIVTPTYQSLDKGFTKTPAYAWLTKNAWKYGFVLRYPKDKEPVTGVIFEPWHFRYVGKEYAKAIYVKQLCLEEYRQILGI